MSLSKQSLKNEYSQLFKKWKFLIGTSILGLVLFILNYNTFIVSTTILAYVFWGLVVWLLIEPVFINVFIPFLIIIIDKLFDIPIFILGLCKEVLKSAILGAIEWKKTNNTNK